MATYLPVLLVSVTTNAIPDDSSVSTLPRGQVDYLSHDWQEEDVWRSWRNMTRQKNEIANGMRLENASWRTWWKQRNKLKTVTPETLNWLKDSDVTWLYGPLHTAVDWTPPPKPAPDPTSVDDKRPPSAHDRFDLAPGAPRATKPILKHRTIGELLTSDLTSGPMYAASPEPAEEPVEASPPPRDHEDDERRDAKRPRLMHTKSESHVTRWATRAFRKDSPPRILAEDAASSTLVDTPASTAAPSLASGSDQDRDAHVPRRERKHITFNTFVEQCIAIEKPQSVRESSQGSSASRRSGHYDGGYDDGYDEDSEGGVLEDDDDDVMFTGETHHPQLEDPANEHCFESDSESEEEMLEIRTQSTPVIRPRPSAARSSSSSSSSSSSRSRSVAHRRPSTTPTVRPSSAGSGFLSGPALLRTPSSEKEHMTIAPIAPTILKSKGVGNGAGDDDGEDPYDYPLGEERRWYTAGGAGVDMPVHLVYVPPLGSNYSMDTARAGESEEDVYRHREAYFSVGTAAAYVHTPAAPSPRRDDGAEEDAYDYFGGPDMGVPFSAERARPRREVRTDDGGRSTPEVVVSAAGEEPAYPRSRSRSRSRSRTPSPAECTPAPAPSIPPPPASVGVPRAPAVPASAPGSASLLSPPERERGRASAPVSENQPRGRSATRGSVSDRERSSSRGTNSPLGSISPEGSAVGLAIGAFGVSANGRDLGAARGRERGTKGVEEARIHSPVQAPPLAASVSDSSSASTVVPAPAPAPTPPSGSSLRISTDGSASPASGSVTPVAAPARQASDEERVRSRQPTPANSPVLSMKPRVFPVAPVQPASPSTTVPPLSPKGIVAHSPSSPSSPRGDDGLVGRAVGMAGAFLGSFWGS